MTKKDFFEENHLQGYIPSSVRLGLYFEGILVSLLTFSKSRFNKNYDWEITRFANKLNHKVVGGLSKMLSYFKKNYEGNIITYSDARLFTGDAYTKSGFKELGLTSPGYKYAPLNRHGDLEGRYQYQKHKNKDFDPDLTEWENMQLRGYDRVWDCGNWKFELKDS